MKFPGPDASLPQGPALTLEEGAKPSVPSRVMVITVQRLGKTLGVRVGAALSLKGQKSSRVLNMNASWWGRVSEKLGTFLVLLHTPHNRLYCYWPGSTGRRNPVTM
jgi:hypothetical protein